MCTPRTSILLFFFAILFVNCDAQHLILINFVSFFFLIRVWRVFLPKKKILLKKSFSLARTTNTRIWIMFVVVLQRLNTVNTIHEHARTQRNTFTLTYTLHTHAKYMHCQLTVAACCCCQFDYIFAYEKISLQFLSNFVFTLMQTDRKNGNIFIVLFIRYIWNLFSKIHSNIKIFLKSFTRPEPNRLTL